MNKFIYAFSDDDRKLLIKKGYHFICENKLNNKIVYIFENKSEKMTNFSVKETKRFMLTNKMRF